MTHESSRTMSGPSIAPRAVALYQILLRVIGPFLGIGAKLAVPPGER